MRKTTVCMAFSIILTLILIAGIFPVAFGALTAEEIIRRRDDNEYYDSAKAEAEMVIINRNRRIVKTMTSYAQGDNGLRSEEHTSELQSRPHLVCRLLLE